MAHEKNVQYQKLTDLLLARRGRCYWAVKGPRMHGTAGTGDSTLECWSVPGRRELIIVHAYPDEGVDIYANGTPAAWPEIEAWLDGKGPLTTTPVDALAAAQGFTTTETTETKETP